KEFQSLLLKFGKEIERKFKPDISSLYHPEAFEGKDDLIGRSLALHFIRQGQFELCDHYLNEAQIPIDDEFRDTVEQLKSEFEQMYKVLHELEQYKLDTAIEWTEHHKEELKKAGSVLEFKLHKMKFIQIMSNTGGYDAMMYSMKHFYRYHDKHKQEIQRLMGSLSFHNKKQPTIYSDLYSPSNWIEVKQQFQKDFCSLLNLSAESPLYTSVYVGTTALPVITKLYKIMMNKKTEWSAQDELPVEIPLEEELRFHSVFACPVSKEQATDENPPMMMPCGHVICKESLMRLSRNSRSSSRFKCPYCPSESSVDQAIQVYF
ncbi:CTLH/CRA C-terminal to lish motif domain-containing protein, partial [Pilobolus umbonatus]